MGRPKSVVAMIALLVFLGITAAAGSSALLVPEWTPPDEWLDGIPGISSWVVPGLVLALGFGVGSLVTAWGVVRRPRFAAVRGLERATGHHWSWAATLALGIGQVVWISLELIYLPELSALQAVYGVVGVALSVLPLVPSVRRDLAVDATRAILAS